MDGVGDEIGHRYATGEDGGGGKGVVEAGLGGYWVGWLIVRVGRV